MASQRHLLVLMLWDFGIHHRRCSRFSGRSGEVGGTRTDIYTWGIGSSGQLGLGCGGGGCWGKVNGSAAHHRFASCCATRVRLPASEEEDEEEEEEEVILVVP